ncbi:MAG: SpoIID/LytB domain-containing protein [Actinomycetia bacterium]|nr:SpoIID/LytB domain-containing protein [Actinomycetes bacterium]
MTHETNRTPAALTHRIPLAGLVVGTALAIIAGVIAVMAPPVRAASAVEAYAVPGSRTFELSGLGYGHGIGMSQFGAEGMGRLGKSYREIVKFYYPGTNLTEVGAGRQITVGLSDVVRSTQQGSAVVIKDRRGLSLRYQGSSVGLPGQVGGRSVDSFRVVRGSGGLAVWAVSPAKTVKVKGGMNRSVRWQTSADVSESRIAVQSESGRTRVYRGWFDVKLGSSSVLPVNRLLLEDYLRSVVSSEVPSSWTDAALRAQAVAARSYALVAQLNARAAHRAYDICDTTNCQVYAPISGESGPEVRAVRATSRQYLRYAGQPVFAMFSSANGGYTVSGGRPYLVAKPDPYDGVVTGSSNWGHKWSTSIDATKLENAWPQIGRLQKLKVLGRDGNGQWGGRVMSVGLVGSKSTVSVSADSFRWATGIKSTWWTITNADGSVRAPAKNVRVDRSDRSAVVLWGAPDTDKTVEGYRITVSSSDTNYRVKAGARRVRVAGLTNGREYRARVAPIYQAGPGPATATPAFVPTSSYSYFQSLAASRLVERGETVAAQRGGTVSVDVLGGGRAPASGTRAVAVRVTAATASNAGRVQVWPCGARDRAQVAVSYQTIGANAGLATVPVPATGRICIGANTNLGSLDVDLLGYYTSSGVGTKALRSVAARRLVNSSSGFGWSSGRLESGEPRTVQIAGREGVPGGARTVLVSVGLVNPSDTATLSVAPGGSPVSLGAAVRAPAKSWRTATTVARLDADGRLPLRLTKGKAQVQVDVLGWFRPQKGERSGRFRSMKGFTALGSGTTGDLTAGSSRSVRVRGGETGVPGAASAVVVQALARSDSSSGYLTVLPTGSSKDARPLLAFDRKGTQRTLMVVPVGADGKITVTAKGADAAVSFRVVGWYS